jgi:hypothetical protein
MHTKITVATAEIMATNPGIKVITTTKADQAITTSRIVVAVAIIIASHSNKWATVKITTTTMRSMTGSKVETKCMSIKPKKSNTRYGRLIGVNHHILSRKLVSNMLSFKPHQGLYSNLILKRRRNFCKMQTSGPLIFKTKT